MFDPVIKIMVTLTLLAAATPLPADSSWEQFRGPRGDGISDVTEAPRHWSETQNITWKTAIHGRGHSSPVIMDGRIWLTTAPRDGKKLYAICVDQETGKILLNRVVFEVAEPDEVIDFNSYASPTPVVEPGRVYVHFGTYGTACLDTRDFKKLWERRDINCDHYRGPGSSPILYRNLLIMNFDGADVQYVIALDKQTGKTVWKTPRSTDFTGIIPDQRKAYSTPLVVEHNGRMELLSVGSQAAMSYNPATGKELWSIGFDGYSNIWRPVVTDGIAYLSTGYDRGEIWAVRLGGSGELTDDQVVWKARKSIGKRPSPLLLDGLLYCQNDGSLLTCLDITDGEIVWRQRVRGNYSASLTYAAGAVYTCSHDGKVTLFKPGREYRELAVNELEEGMMASPAFVDRSMFLRTDSHLYRIEEK